MPRKKTTPTVATTEPDTTLNPDRAQVAAVADLPHAHEPAPVTSVFRVEQVPPSREKVPSREWMDWCEAKIAEQDAALQAIARVVGMVSAGDLAEVVARVRTIAEQSTRIAELTAERDAIQHHHDEWMKFRGDADLELANLRRDGREEDRNRIAELEAELVRVALESLTPVPVPARPLTPHEIAAGYLAITSGNVRAARWKRNILHDIRDPDMVIGQIDHLTDGWAPSVKGAAAPPMKTEAEARAWCEARCGWTVVA